MAIGQALVAERELERQFEQKEISLEVFHTRRERVFRCTKELGDQKGLRDALRTPAAIEACLEEVTALAGSPAPR